MSDVLEITELDNGDYQISFPDELCEELGWREGDLLDWRLKGTSIVLSKVNDPEGYEPLD